jgi:ribosomal protein L16 Arg81 hydroxylase
MIIPECKGVTHMKNIGAELFTWDDVIKILDDDVKGNGYMRLFPKLGLLIHNAERIRNVQSVMDEINKLNSDDNLTAHCYISFSEHSENFGNHCDDADVFFWQVIGRTKWIVEGDEYILEPNDMIYVPKKVYHKVVPLSPRVGISFGFEYP